MLCRFSGQWGGEMKALLACLVLLLAVAAGAEDDYTLKD